MLFIVIKLEGLEDGHALKSLGANLLQKVDASFAAWDVYGKAVSRLKELRAAEELSNILETRLTATCEHGTLVLSS